MSLSTAYAQDKTMVLRSRRPFCVAVWVCCRYQPPPWEQSERRAGQEDVGRRRLGRSQLRGGGKPQSMVERRLTEASWWREAQVRVSLVRRPWPQVRICHEAEHGAARARAGRQSRAEEDLSKEAENGDFFLASRIPID